MMISRNYAGPIALALVLGLGQAGCNTRTPETDDAAPAPVDRGVETADTATRRQPDTSVATPPITPPAPAPRDTPPAGAAKPSQPSGQAAVGQGLKLGAVEYEGWRQYSVNCARCHGQDVLPNPVAANLLVSLGPNGPVNTPEKFRQVTSEGRPDRGMPAFKSLLTPEQIDAIYAYVKGRAEGRIPAGRPDKPRG
jgi:mono/diheme cytochrome c family protein